MIANGEKRASFAVVVFVTSATVLIRICISVADKILLSSIYGWRRLLAEHLTIVRDKPNMVVSNGDILYGKGFPHYLIVVALWIPSTVLLLSLLFRLLPVQEREALQGKYTVSGLTIPIVVALFFAIGLLPLTYSALLAVFVLATALLLPWVRRELQNSR